MTLLSIHSVHFALCVYSDWNGTVLSRVPVVAHRHTMVYAPDSCTRSWRVLRLQKSFRVSSKMQTFVQEALTVQCQTTAELCPVMRGIDVTPDHLRGLNTNTIVAV